jgi:hypothetical protein
MKDICWLTEEMVRNIHGDIAWELSVHQLDFRFSHTEACA